jgi:transposase InsO family protein
MKKQDAALDLSSFLKDLESEIRRQAEASSIAITTPSATALAVSQPNNTSIPQSNNTHSSQPTQTKSNNSKKNRVRCENGVHNPAATHSEDDCHSVHPEKAVAYFQAAMDRANARVAKKAMLSVNSGVADSIILDSGATGHYLKHRSYFTTFQTYSSTVYAANGSAIPILGEGSATINTPTGQIKIAQAYFVPDLSNSLLPLTHYLQRGYTLSPSDSGTQFCFKKDSHILCTGTTSESVLTIDTITPRAFATLADPIILHNSLGHPSLPYLKAAYPELSIKDLQCNNCDLAKMHQQPFPGHFPKVDGLLDCVHMDLCGPITPATRGGNRYFLKIVDGHSKFRFIFPMPSKSDTYDHFLTFLNRAETFTGRQLKSVVSDNGGEFVNKRFADLYQKRGITHHTSAPYTPQQNPFAERGNRTTVEKARALLLTSGLDLHWWGEAVTTSVFLENCSPDSSISMKSPFELWTGKPPDLSRLRPFGCRAVLLEERKFRNSKFSPSGVEAILIGFDETHLSYKLWVPASNKIKLSHHVKFHPSEFPMLISPPPRSPIKDWCSDLFELAGPLESSSTTDEPAGEDTTPHEDQAISDSPTGSKRPDSSFLQSQADNITPERQEEDPLAIPNLPMVPSATKGYAYVPYYDVASKDISSNIDPSNIVEGSRRHRACAVEHPRLHKALVIVGEPASLKDPKTFAQAMRRLDRNEWLMAVEVELNNIKCHEVWVVAPMKVGTRLLDTVWVFKRKYNADGELLKFKARLCVRGFRQLEGIDYGATFAPTGRLATLRVLLGVAAARDYQVEQMDVRCAFLNGVPDEEIYLKVPDGVDIEVPPGYGLKLQKSLYGLKQSP